MKKQLALGALGALFILGAGLTSCGPSSLVDGPETGAVLPPAEGKGITFTFAAPKGLPTTYALHDAAEWAIKENKIHLYEFLAKDDSFVKMHELTLTPAGDATYKVETSTSTFTGTGGTTFPGQNRRFLFVANAPALTGLSRSTTLDDVRKMVLGAAQASNASCKTLLQDEKYIPMVGEAKTDFSGAESTSIPVDGGATVSVDLVRDVARIDIQTTMGPNFLNPTLKKLVIRKAVLTRAVDKTSVGADLLTSATNTIEGVTTFATIPTGGVEPDKVPDGQTHGQKGKLQKAFYLYETTAEMEKDKDKMPAVKITFTYGDDPHEYQVTVPFYQNGKVVPVQRNYLYTIVLGPDEQIEQGVTFALAVNEWEGPEKLSHALNLVAPAAGASSVTGLDLDSHTLSVAKDASSTAIEIPFASNFANSNNTFTAELKKRADGSTPSWLTVEADGDKVKVTNLRENTTGKERTAVILVRDNTTDAITYQLVVKQAAN